LVVKGKSPTALVMYSSIFLPSVFSGCGEGSRGLAILDFYQDRAVDLFIIFIVRIKIFHTSTGHTSFSLL
jgi:hypothetical protein